MLLIDNPAIDKTKLPGLGDTITGTAKTVTIDDIIAAEGERIPNASTSQKKFNIGFVLLTRAGDNTTAAVQAVETVRNAFAGTFAEMTRGIGGIEGVAPSLTVTIESPVSGATITTPYTTVSGSFINTSGAETGITINGMPAIVSGSRFIANNVSLQSGDNTITITATDANGLTATATKSVTTQAGNYLRITSNIESGTGPLDVSLRVDGSFTPTNPQISIQGPAPATLQAGTQANEYTARLTVEGNYTITATATGPDGQTYTASTIITVLNRYQLETLLQGKWEGMKQKLAAGDVEGAVLCLPSSKQPYYREMFTAMGIRLPVFAEDMPMPRLGPIRDYIAKLLMSRQETVLGQQRTVGYLMYFIKENGIWKLRDL